MASLLGIGFLLFFTLVEHFVRVLAFFPSGIEKKKIELTSDEALHLNTRAHRE